jgi:Plasmid pRiA4b ORF-3-like protein
VELAATVCQIGGMSTDDTAVLRIELSDIEPLIWRRVAVRTATNLQTLHRIIQPTVGWLDYHLWEFTADDKTYGVPDPEDADWGHKVYRATNATLARLIEGGVTAFDYTYDMGDNWEHRIIIERVEPAEPGKLYPDFLAGERRCPPEDCGSVSGYYDFLDAIAGPDKGKGSRRKKEMLAWYGRPYDPDDIDEAQIRTALKRIANTSRRGRSTTADG